MTSTDRSTATAGQLYRYDVSASDPDGDALSFDLPVAPAGMTVHPTLGVLVWTPTADQLGTFPVVLRVRDGQGGVLLRSFQVAVGAPNSPPVIASTPPTGPATVGDPFEYPIAAQDAESGTLTFSLRDPLPGMSIGRDTGVFTWTPDPAQAGDQTVTVVVSDGMATSEQSFSLPVVLNGSNHDPTVRAEVPGTAWLGRVFLGRVLGADADGDPVRYELVQGPAGLTVDAQSGVIRWQPTALTATPTAVEIRVTDGRGGQTSALFDVVVLAQDANHAPLVISNPPPTAITGAPYAYDLAARDPDGDPVIWQMVSGSRGMSLDAAAGTLRWTPTDDQRGVQTITVRALDPLLAAGTQTFTVTVSCHNQAPAITSRPPTLVHVGEVYTYAVRATDPESDPLTFSVVSGPTGMAFVPGTSLLTWTPTADNSAPQEDVLIRVTDAAGNDATQSFRVVVSTQTPNHAPVITSRPQTSATLKRQYAYDVTTRDADGDTLHFALTAAPPGMTINATTGAIRWTPTAAGNPVVIVEVTDGRGGVAAQTFLVAARANQAPTLKLIADPSATLGGTFRAAAKAADPDNDPLTFRLDQAPAGMTIDAQGRILWTPKGAPRSETVRVSVSDPDGLSASGTFTVAVVADTMAPHATVTLSSNLVDPGAVITFRVATSDNVGVASTTLTVGGQAVALDAAGTARTVLNLPGVYPVVATVTDPAGNVTTATAEVRVLAPADAAAPLVEITSPDPSREDNEAPFLTDIVGSVSDDNLDFWRVEYARADQVDPSHFASYSPDWVVLARGTTNVSNARLAVFDPTTLPNDQYVIRLFAQDVNGLITTRGVRLNVAGNAKLGNFHLEFTDLSIAVLGLPIQVTRVYDTLQAADEGDFGFGWKLGLRDADIRETVPDGGDFVAGKTRVYLTDPEGKRVGFTYQERPVNASFFGVIAEPYFVADPGVQETLEVPDTQIGRGGILGALSGPYNPDTYFLTTKDGTSYEYSQSAGLQKVIDLNGHTVTFTRDGILASNGDSVQFVRDSQGRITKITDPDGHSVSYRYDALGNLVTFTDQESLLTRYGYLTTPAHFLQTITDPNNHQVFKAEFDAAGRLIGSTDAVGGHVGQSFDPSTFTGTQTDANGNVTQLLYNARGNVLRETDALGFTKSCTWRETMTDQRL